MAFCQSCGKELTADAAFCHHCGARVVAAFPFVGWQRRWERDRQGRREQEERNGWWGAVSAFGFLVIIGLTISQYPDVFLRINAYIQSWSAHGYPVLPTSSLGQVIIYFLTVSGIWGLIAAALRFAYTDSLSRPMQDIVGALFALYVASSFSQFYAHTIDGPGLVLAFFVGLAVVIIANAVIRIFVPRHLRPMAPSEPAGRTPPA